MMLFEDSGKNWDGVGVVEGSVGGSWWGLRNFEVVLWRREGGRCAWWTTGDAAVGVRDQRLVPMP